MFSSCIGIVGCVTKGLQDRKWQSTASRDRLANSNCPEGKALWLGSKEMKLGSAQKLQKITENLPGTAEKPYVQRSGGAIGDPQPLWKIFSKNKQRVAQVFFSRFSSDRCDAGENFCPDVALEGPRSR